MNPNSDQSTENLLHTARYGVYWFSSLLSNIGTWMQQIAQPWVILSLSHSSFLVGLDSFMLNAPSWVFTLWGGVIADRMDRKAVILVCQSIQFLSVVLLLVLLLTNLLQVWMIVLISFVIGTTDSLSMPSFQSIIPSIVSAKDIPRAVALNSTQFNLSRMLGPALAGVIIAKFGVKACFGANALSYLPFFISLFWIYPKHVKISRENSASGTRGLHFAEFKKLLMTKDVRTPLARIFTNSFFCGPVVIFCPVLIKDIFHSGVGNFGGAMAAFGFGGLIGAVGSLTRFSENLDFSFLSRGLSFLLGILVLVVAVNRSLPMLTFLMALAGVALTVSNVSANSFLQKNADHQTRGKTVSLFQLALQGGMSAGGLLTGLTSSRWGVPAAFLVNGTAALFLQSFIWWQETRYRDAPLNSTLNPSSVWHGHKKDL